METVTGIGATCETHPGDATPTENPRLPVEIDDAVDCHRRGTGSPFFQWHCEKAGTGLFNSTVISGADGPSCG